MIHGSQLLKKRSHFIVPRRELIRQMSKNFSDFGIPHSFIAQGYSMNPHALTHIGSLASMKGRVERLPPPQVAFIDETHYGGGLLDWLYDYYTKIGCWIIGLSATPKPGKYYHSMVCSHSIKWHIENKFLSEYRLFAANFPDLSMIKQHHGEYSQVQLADRMEKDEKIIGDAVRHYKSNAMGKLNLVFATSQKHGELINERFNNSGIPSAVLSSKTPENQRMKIIQAFARRELLNLSTVDICTFGFDLSANAGMDVTVESMSDLAPTMSLPKQLQKWGRILRRKDYPALIFDHVGNSMKSPNEPKHGLPDWDREWDLREVDKKLRRAGEKAMPVITCKSCFFCYDPARRACPHCGTIPVIDGREIKEVEGILNEVNLAAIKQEKRIRRARVRTLEDLFEVMAENQYKLGWVLKFGKTKGIIDDRTTHDSLLRSWNEWRRRNTGSEIMDRVTQANAG